MSNILVPVDYSFPSHNAYHFGLFLAKALGTNVILAHYYTGAIDPNTPLTFAGDGTLQGSHVDRLRQFAHASGDGSDYAVVEPPPGVTVSYETRTTNAPSATIVERARQEDIRYVVMATRSTKKLLGKWLGSTATTVSEASNRPVFLVPPEVRFTEFDRIVVANNHETAEAYPLRQIEGLAEWYGGRVHFVHVDHPGKELPLRFKPWKLMEQLVDEDRGVDYPFEVVAVEEMDIAKGLLTYADEVDADLLVIVNRRRKWWQSLLSATLTQDLALRAATLPLLVLHVEA